jgi:hypothetical protein
MRQRRSRLPLVLAALGGLAPSARAAPAVETEVTNACALDGYVTDPDPAGTNVRAAPRADAAIVGHLPSEAERKQDSADAGRPQFRILGSRNGWLLIRDAHIEDPAHGSSPLFAGPGWISGGLVGFTIGSNELRNAPAADTAIVAELVGADRDGNAWGPDSFQVIRVHACTGHFAEVTIVRAGHRGAGSLRGWVGKACANQLTTCDPG